MPARSQILLLAFSSLLLMSCSSGEDTPNEDIIPQSKLGQNTPKIKKYPAQSFWTMGTRDFYILDDSYICNAQGGGSFQTYRDSITVRPDRVKKLIYVVNRGGGCSDTRMGMTYRESGGFFNKFIFSDNFQTLTVEGKTYQYLPIGSAPWKQVSNRLSPTP